MNSIDQYLTTHDDEFQSWTRNVPWIYRVSTKEERYAIRIKDGTDEQFPVLRASGSQTHQVESRSAVLRKLLHVIKEQITQYNAYKDEDLRLRILLKTNIDNLMRFSIKNMILWLKKLNQKQQKSEATIKWRRWSITFM